MRLHHVLFLCVFLVLAACQEPLSAKEVLERSQQEMSGLNSYAFDINTLFVDGVENETKERTEGTVNVEPYEASYVYTDDFYSDEPTIHVIALEDMYYQAFLEEPTEFMKVTYEHDRHHMQDLIPTMQEYMNAFLFEEKGESYHFVFQMDDYVEMDFLKAFYPEHKSMDPDIENYFRIYFDHSEIADLELEVHINKSDFFVTDVYLDIIFAYDILESGEPTSLYETIKVSYSQHNEESLVDIPKEDLEAALTIEEIWEIRDQELEEERKNHVPALIEEKMGNVSSNLAHGGEMVTDGQWRYYSDMEKGLVREKLDGSEQKQLLEHHAHHLQIIDGELYFIEQSMEPFIYKMDLDGSNQEVLHPFSVSSFYIVDEWVYFIEVEYEAGGKSNLYRMNLDQSEGTVSHLLAEDVYHMHAGQNNVLFFEKGYENRIQMVRMDEIEESAQTISSFHRAGHMMIVDGWLYFEDLEDNNRIYRESAETGQLDPITEVGSSGFTVYNDFVIYYNAEANAVYAYHLKSGEETLLIDEQAFKFNIIEDTLYYRLFSDLERQWMSIDLKDELKG